MLPDRPSETLRNSPLTKIALLGALILGLQIPVWMIHDLVGERAGRRWEAIEEVTQKWGRAQVLSGPMLVVPIRKIVRDLDDSGKPRTREVASRATFLPETLRFDGKLQTERRHRGIYEIPVYRSELRVDGRFARPPEEGIPDVVAMYWDQAQLVFELADPRGLEGAAELVWNDEPIDFRPGTGHGAPGRSGIHVPVTLAAGSEGFDFHTQLDLRGSSRMAFVPVGQQTRVRLSGDWPDPGFQGAWLPRGSEIDAGGFSADWQIPYLGRNFPQSWTGEGPRHAIDAAAFGVDLVTLVDAYRASQRSLKYQLLFLGLTFVTLWLVEILANARVHAVQYGLIGSALCLFYLLELSLSEHIGLGAAYAIGAFAVIALVFGYVRAILGRLTQAVLVAGVVAGLYAYLYVLLQLEDYALLIGSIGLFTALGAIMYATRSVDWYGIRPLDQARELSEAASLGRS